MANEVKKCKVFVSVSEHEYDFVKGPSKNSIYPAEWVEKKLPTRYVDSFDEVRELLATQLAAYICSCTRKDLVDWDVISFQHGGVQGYAGKMHAICRNPFLVDRQWHVYGWIRYCIDDCAS